MDSYIVGAIAQGIWRLEQPSYEAPSWQLTLLIILSVASIGLFNTYGARHLPLAEGIFVTFHFFAFFPSTLLSFLILLWLLTCFISHHYTVGFGEAEARCTERLS